MLKHAFVAAVVVKLAVWLAGPATASTVDYPVPDALPPVDAASLEARYAAVRETVRDAAGIARVAGDQRRAAVFGSLTGRSLLEFDPRGQGRVVEVIGDLARADRIAVMVPGSHTRMDTFDRGRGPGGSARALAAEIAATDPAARVAVVAWLGYDTPQGLSAAALTDAAARTGAEALRITVADLRAVNATAPIALFCHSYGSVVCAYAAPDLPVADLVVYGSPGIGVGSVDELPTTARVWAGRTEADWIRFVPSVRVAGIGFGADPVEPEFGACHFTAGAGSHGDYHLPGGESLSGLARIALGTSTGCEVRHG